MTRSKERSKLDFKMILIACLARAFRIVVLAWKKLLKASYTFRVLMACELMMILVSVLCRQLKERDSLQCLLKAKMPGMPPQQ